MASDLKELPNSQQCVFCHQYKHKG